MQQSRLKASHIVELESEAQLTTEFRSFSGKTSVPPCYVTDLLRV